MPITPKTGSLLHAESHAEYLLADEVQSRTRSAHTLAIHACEQVGYIILETWKHKYGEGKGVLKVKDSHGNRVKAHVLKMFAFFSLISAERIVWYRHARRETRGQIQEAEEVQRWGFSSKLLDRIRKQLEQLVDDADNFASSHDLRLDQVLTRSVEMLRQAYLYVDNRPDIMAALVPASAETVKTSIGDCTTAIGLLENSKLIDVSFALFEGELTSRGYEVVTYQG